MLTGEWTGRKTATDCCKVVRQYTTVRWLCDFFSKARKPRNIDIARGTIIVIDTEYQSHVIIEDGCLAVHTRLSSVVSAMSFPSPSKNLRNARAKWSRSNAMSENEMTSRSNSSPGMSWVPPWVRAATGSIPLFAAPWWTDLQLQWREGPPYRHSLSAEQTNKPVKLQNIRHPTTANNFKVELTTESRTCWSLQANTAHRISSRIYPSELAWMGCESSRHCTCQAVNRLPVFKSLPVMKMMWDVYVLLWNGMDPSFNKFQCPTHLAFHIFWHCMWLILSKSSLCPPTLA